MVFCLLCKIMMQVQMQVPTAPWNNTPVLHKLQGRKEKELRTDDVPELCLAGGQTCLELHIVGGC